MNEVQHRLSIAPHCTDDLAPELVAYIQTCLGMQTMSETIADTESNDQTEKNCPQCNCCSRLKELKCGHVLCNPCVNALREIYNGKIFCPHDMQESKDEDLKWKTEEEGEENNQRVTEIKLLIEKSCKQRKTTTDIFKKVAAELQSFVKKPTREIPWHMIVTTIMLLIAPLNHLLVHNLHESYHKIIATGVSNKTLIIQMPLFMLFATASLLQVWPNVCHNLFELMISGTSVAICGYSMLSIASPILEDIFGIFGYNAMQVPDVLLLVTGVLFCVGIGEAAYSQYMNSDVRKLKAYCNSEAIKEHEKQLMEDHAVCERLKIILYRAEEDQDRFCSNWLLRQECARKVKGVVEAGAESYDKLGSLCKAVAECNHFDCICQLLMRLILPEKLIPLHLGEFIRAEVKQGKTVLEVSEDLKIHGHQLEFHLKRGLLCSNYLVYYCVNTTPTQSDWQYLAFPPMAIEQLETWRADNNNKICRMSRSVTEILKHLLDGKGVEKKILDNLKQQQQQQQQQQRQQQQQQQQRQQRQLQQQQRQVERVKVESLGRHHSL